MEKHIMSSQEGFGPEFKPRSFLLSGNRVNHVVVKLFAVFLVRTCAVTTCSS